MLGHLTGSFLYVLIRLFKTDEIDICQVADYRQSHRGVSEKLRFNHQSIGLSGKNVREAVKAKGACRRALGTAVLVGQNDRRVS